VALGGLYAKAKGKIREKERVGARPQRCHAEESKGRGVGREAGRGSCVDPVPTGRVAQSCVNRGAGRG
jgi:hypothetical protein